MKRFSFSDLLNPREHKWAYSSPLRKYATQFQRNVELTKIVQHAFGSHLGPHVVEVQLSYSRLMLLVDSSAYTAQVRLMSTQVLEKLNSMDDFRKVNKVVIRTVSRQSKTPSLDSQSST